LVYGAKTKQIRDRVVSLLFSQKQKFWVLKHFDTIFVGGMLF
jgi:hypothetical protein